MRDRYHVVLFQGTAYVVMVGSSGQKTRTFPDNELCLGWIFSKAWDPLLPFSQLISTQMSGQEVDGWHIGVHYLPWTCASVSKSVTIVKIAIA